MRVVCLAVLLSLFAACGGDDAALVCDFREVATCAVEIKTGDLVRVKLPPPTFVDNGEGQLGTQYRWTVLPALNMDLLEFAEGSSGDGDDFLLRAVGPGMQTVRWAEVSQLPEPLQSYYMDVTITGEGTVPPGSYLQNIAVAGGLGSSVESGSSLSDLSLYPTDIFSDDDEVYVVSEGRLWSIDRAANVGNIVMDTALAGTAWPASGSLVSMSPLDAGGYIALIGLGTSISVVQIAAGFGSFTELYSATSLDLRPDCTTCQEGIDVRPGRIRASGDGANWVASADSVFQIRNGVVYANDSQERTGHLVDLSGEFVPADQDGTGMDQLGGVLFWASGGGSSGTTTLSTYVNGVPQTLFTFIGYHSDRVDRETDFQPFSNGGSAVVGLSDGSYWTHSHHEVMRDALVVTVQRGLFVHRP